MVSTRFPVREGAGDPDQDEMSERRYDGQEIEEIFRRATEPTDTPSWALEGSKGLTLGELQEIGRETGIAPERVADAALALDRPADSALSMTVRRTVPLPRNLTDGEWERLVADLRATFDAPGRVHRDGGLRGWTNGNLHAFVEPTGSGHRLRMGTTKGNARALVAGGAGLLALSLVILVIRLVAGDLADALDVVALLSLLGLGSIGAGALQLPGWAGTRGRQMDEIGARLRASIEDDEGD